MIGPDGDMIWLSESTGENADGQPEWRLLDLVNAPRFADPFNVSFDCGTDGPLEDGVVAVAHIVDATGGRDYESVEVLAAWRARRDTGKLEPLDPLAVTCSAYGD
jgi:hypothetical protein